MQMTLIKKINEWPDGEIVIMSRDEHDRYTGIFTDELKTLLPVEGGDAKGLDEARLRAWEHGGGKLVNIDGAGSHKCWIEGFNKGYLASLAAAVQTEWVRIETTEDLPGDDCSCWWTRRDTGGVDLLFYYGDEALEYVEDYSAWKRTESMPAPFKAEAEA